MVDTPNLFLDSFSMIETNNIIVIMINSHEENLRLEMAIMTKVLTL